MSNNIYLTKIILSSGEELNLSPGITAIVGPNNAGKSLLLRELQEYLLAEQGNAQLLRHKIVSNVEMNYEGTAEKYLESMKLRLPIRPAGNYTDGNWIEDTFMLPQGQALPFSVPESIWGRNGQLGNLFGSYFSTYLNAESRLGLAADAGTFDPLTQSPSNPLQKLLINSDLEKKVNEAVLPAFKEGITVNRLPGSTIHLHAGQTTNVAESLTPSLEYVEELLSLPLMQLQGDGMRAFVGMVMSVVTGQFPLLLIDEPEAFLHPPQARRFGQFLAKQKLAGTQVIVATHSEDIIAGLTLEKDQHELSLTRITRQKNSNYISQLQPAVVRELFTDPLIRYFNMMNGLFAQGVVLCEADGDCTYFRAVIDHQSPNSLPILADAHFTHAAGKSRVPKALSMFRTVSVPVVAIYDIDILRDDTEFEATVKAIGYDPAMFKVWRNTIEDEVSGARAFLSRADLRRAIKDILANSEEKNVSQSDLKRIRSASTAGSGWSSLKKAGISMLSAGGIAAYKEIKERLEAKGVFILEQGELERLHPEVSGEDKARWLRTVIDEGLYKHSVAMPMLSRIEAYLSEAQKI